MAHTRAAHLSHIADVRVNGKHSKSNSMVRQKGSSGVKKHMAFMESDYLVNKPEKCWVIVYFTESASLYSFYCTIITLRRHSLFVNDH